ncbi:hypothetical protein Tco_0429607 [Tanacetum coccineum]
MVEVAHRLLRLRWCRSGGCGGVVVMLMAAAVGDEGDGDEGGVACGGAKVEGDGIDVMMAAGWGEAGDAAVYDDGGRRQVAGDPTIVLGSRAEGSPFEPSLGDSTLVSKSSLYVGIRVHKAEQEQIKHLELGFIQSFR